jgi:segregation and condensation protein A
MMWWAGRIRGQANGVSTPPPRGSPVQVGLRVTVASVTAAVAHAEEPTGFSVHLEEFSGPFDLLLQMISKHKLEVTELALSQVTDDFVRYIREQGRDWDLEEASHFLVVAATLLDLKVVKLLPGAEVEDEEDLALLEARDLLFARLMQYRAYKDVSATFGQMMADAPVVAARTAGLDPQFHGLLPDVVLGLGPEAFAALAAVALTPKPVPQVDTDHVHAPAVSVEEQKGILAQRLQEARRSTFRDLIHDAQTRMVVVGRFLALLELYRDGSVRFEQERALAELTIVWEDVDGPPGD